MKRATIILLFQIAFLFTSCQYKDLFYGSPDRVSVEVKFDWENDPDANPASMMLYMYPVDGGMPLNYQFIGKEGGRINVPAGSYRMITFNSDTETIIHENTEDFDSFDSRTTGIGVVASMGLMSVGAPQAPGAETEPVRMAPEMFWSDRIKEPLDLTIMDSKPVIVFTPDNDVIEYSFTIKNIENLKYVSRVSGALSGMPESLLLSQPVTSETTCTIPFDIESDNISTLSGSTLAFGHCPTVINTHYLTIYFILTDGTKWYYSVDVTDQIHNWKGDARHVKIVIDNVPLPEPISPEGTFDVNVGDWVDVIVPLPVI